MKNKSKKVLLRKKVINRSLTLIGFIIILFATTLVSGEEVDKVLLSINNEEVKKSEFMINYNGKLKESFDILLENKALLKILMDSKLIESDSYEDILKHLNKENKNRKEAKEKGEVIYGPVEYSEKQYYEYLLSEGRAELERLVEGEHKENIEKRSKEFYEENIENFKIEDGLKCEIISISFINEDGSVSNEEKKNAKKLADDIKNNFTSEKHTSLENVCKNEMDFNYENKSIDDNYKAEIKSLAMELDINEVSTVIEFNGAYHIIRCLDRYDQGYEEFNLIKDQIYVMEIDRLISELIDKEIKDMNIEVHEEVLKSIEN